MSRIRMVKPAFFKHADLYEAEVSSGLPLRIAFAGLWTVADKRGVFPWSRNIKPDVLPYDQCDMLAVLDALAASGFVVRYEVDGKSYGIIPSFTDHQTFHKNEKESTLPAPPEHSARTVLAPEQHSSRPTGTGTVEGTVAGTTTGTAEEEGPPSPAVTFVNQLVAALPVDRRAAWSAEIGAAQQGMHGPILTEDQIERACRDYIGNGNLERPNLKHFRGYLANVGATSLPRRAGGAVDESAWDAALDVVKQLTRRELTADAFGKIPEHIRRGLKAAGGWQAIRDAKQDDMPFRKRDFLKGAAA
jgi:hypothetical protein